MTMPAQAERPDSAAVAADSASSIGPPSAMPASIARRSSTEGSAACIMPSTKRRNPVSVGMRPAEVCGAASSPSSSRSCITLRIDAGDRLSEAILLMVREPTGRPVPR